MQSWKNVPLIKTGKKLQLMQSWKYVPLMKIGRNVPLKNENQQKCPTYDMYEMTRDFSKNMNDQKLKKTYE